MHEAVHDVGGPCHIPGVPPERQLKAAKNNARMGTKVSMVPAPPNTPSANRPVTQAGQPVSDAVSQAPMRSMICSSIMACSGPPMR